MIKKKEIKKIIQIIIFISLANLPFLTTVQIIGMDTFLDSFENPDQYICIQNNQNTILPNIPDGKYIIIQKSTHPGFSLKKDDEIIYINEGKIACNKILDTTIIGATKRYYINGENNEISTQPIYESQIIGRVVNIIDDNLWTGISMKIWETSIQQLNINGLLIE